METYKTIKENDVKTNDEPSKSLPDHPVRANHDSSYVYPDLPHLIAVVLNPMGRYQIALLLALTFNSAIVGISHTLTSFHTYTPDFYCEVWQYIYKYIQYTLYFTLMIKQPISILS